MKSIEEFLSELRRLDVKLWVEDVGRVPLQQARLQYKAPPETLTPALLQQLKERKIEVITFLHNAKAAASGNLPPILPASREGNIPLSFAQARLWFLDQLRPGSSTYNMSAVYRLTGSLNVAALEQSLNEIVRRHEVLRTTFLTVDGQSSQVIAPSIDLTLPVIDLREQPDTEREAIAQQIATEEAQQPFDLAQGPLWRIKLLRLAEAEHVLFLSLHHIVFDGWSYDIFLWELAALYKAFSTGKPSPLLELFIQYADFAHWQREWLQGQVLKSQLDYWKQQLDDDLPVLQLPTDQRRSGVQTHRGAKQSLELPKYLTEGLKVLCQQEEVTLFMALLAAFQTLLHRYSGQEDIIVGSPIAGRNQMETEALIGLFLNALPIRTDLSGNPTFRQLLSRVREVTLGAYAHQHLPFEKLVEELQPERSLSRHPVFDVMLNFINTPQTTLELPGLTLTPFLELAPLESKFTMTLYVRECQSQLSLQLVYQRDLFSSERMACLLEQLQCLLEQIVAAPEKPIRSYSLVTTKSRLLLPHPGEAIPEPQYEPITTLFTSWVTRTPEHAAVCQGDRTWTYSKLAASAHAIAQLLLARGADRGNVVAVCGPRSFGLIASMLGVLLSRNVLLTLDQNLPKHRQQLMLTEAKAQHLLYVGIPTSEVLWEPLEIIFIEPDTGKPKAPHSPPLTSHSQVSLSPDAAYIFFTSGTTGIPKGILGCHKGISHFLNWQRQTFDIGPQDRTAQLTGLSFDVVLRDIFLPLTSGATLCLPTEEDNLSPARILPWLEREQISLLHTVPSLAKSWLANLPPGVALGSLRWIFFAGEPLTETLVHRWHETFPKTGEIVNLYGPTETTLAKCYYQVPADVPPGVQPVGSPLPATQALILGENDQLCGIGELGEIVLRTPFRSLGYINASEPGRQRFVKNPFRDDEEDLLYYTGDRGRYRPDGSLEILGRLDHQVKIRGVRIEPGEIETVLGQHPSVWETVVIASEDVSGDKRLVAYVVPSQKLAANTSELRKFLGQRLPDYMMPSTFVMLEALPLTPNGKIDRRALPVPDTARPVEATLVAPRTPVEETLALIWAEVLNLNQVGIHDNFFELGGHSLLATQIISRVRNTFQVELPLRRLFETPTVASLAEALTGLSFPNAPSQAIQLGGNIPCCHNRDSLPLSFAQARLWFLEQLEPNTSVYNIPQALRLHGVLNLAALQNTLDALVARHEILRTTFATRDGDPVQVIAASRMVDLLVIDLRQLSASEQEVEVQHLLRQEAQRPFNLAADLMLRATLLQLNQAKHILILVMHHIAADGWSVKLMFQEMAIFYKAFCTGQSSPLQELPIQYADFAAWQRKWLSTEVLSTHLAYWKQQLDGAPPLLELPTDQPRPAVQTFSGQREFLLLSAPLSASLKALSRDSNATLFMTLLAAFQLLLHRYTGSDDIVVGSPIAGRNHLEIEGLIGLFVNSLVLRTNLSGSPSFRELLQRVRQVALGAHEHQDMPFEKLVGELQPERNLSHNPLFQVMFVLQNAPSSPLELAGLSINSLKVPSRKAKFDLTLAMEETESGLKGVFEYNSDLFEAATIKRMVGHLQTLLEGIVANPEQRVSQLPLLTASEQQQLLVEWNHTQEEYCQHKCIHQLFEEQVAQTPEAIAVVFEDQQLTYQELNTRSNQLAHHLQSLGVGPEVLVGIFIERSLEMVVGLLGIFKAGGVYVPLDPTYPQERLAFMLSDARVSVLLTQRHLLDGLLEHEAKVVCLDRESEVLCQDEQNPASELKSENLAYVIYTSGSTGRPKGVLISHQAIVSHCLSIQKYYQLNSNDRVLQLASLNFDVSIEQILLPLIKGGSIVLPDPEIWSPQELLLKISELKITIVNLPTAYWQQAATEWSNLIESFPSNQLKLVTVGGETLLPEYLRLWWKAAVSSVHLVNVYGPTETTIAAVAFPVPEFFETSNRIPIGRPLGNTTIYILDKYGNPVPIGVPGELYIGGDGLARGYLNRPELTDERFISHPFMQQPGARLYKTGDLARYLADGNIEFLGRFDNQVKVRGFRIELGEVETVLSQHPEVREVAVIAREDNPGDKRLVAYVVPNETEFNTNTLRFFLKEKLPDYMVPSAFVLLEALPLMPSGKVDRRSLPALDTGRPDLGKTFVAPRTPVEEVLSAVWSQVLRIEQIGIYDNFFELGGDSILSIQIVARASQKGLQLTPKQLFQHQTIAELASVACMIPSTQLEQGLVIGSVPLTPIQHWFFEQNLPDPDHFNQSFLLEVLPNLNPEFLKQTVQHLLGHHDALRLRFVRTELTWQSVNAAPNQTVPFHVVDLSSLSLAEQQEAIETEANQLQSSLNLSEGPLLRVTLFNLGIDKPGRLLLIIHHLAVDGVSWRILLEDISTAYQQLSRGEAIQLPSKTTSFKDWSERLRTYGQSEALKAELDYWLAPEESEAIPLPVDYVFGREDNTVASAAQVSVALSEKHTRALLQEVPSAYNTQINDVLLTALVQSFVEWTGVSSLLIDLEGHGREELFEEVNLSRTVGWFTTVFPVRLEFEDHPGEALKSVKEQLRRTPQRGIGYGVLRYLNQEAVIRGKLQALPQAEVSFNYLGQFDQVLGAFPLLGRAKESRGAARSGRGSRVYLLEVNGLVVAGRLQMSWTYSKKVHQRSTVERLAQEFLKSLQVLIAHCKSLETQNYTPSDFPEAELSQQELDELIAKLSQT